MAEMAKKNIILGGVGNMGHVNFNRNVDRGEQMRKNYELNIIKIIEIYL